MKLPYLFLLVGLLFFTGCRSSQRIPLEGQIKVSQPWVFSIDFQKALFKTDMLVFGNDLSGLMMIKKTGSSYRVVLLSEVGLKYFDMEFFAENDSVKIHHVINFLDRKPVLEMIENNYRLVFMIYPEKRKEKFYRDSMSKRYIKEIKSKRHKSQYTYDPNFGMVSTIFDKKGGANLVISADIRDRSAPETINFNQNNLNMRLERID